MSELDEHKCKRFRKSREIEKNDGRTYYTYTNPLTNRKLKQCSVKFNEINEHCNTILGMENSSRSVSRTRKIRTKEDPNKLIVDAWIKDPEHDPRTKKSISVSGAEYVQLYDIAYEYLLSIGISKEDIKQKMPKHHILFKKIDILYYRKNIDTYDGIEKDMYESIDTFLKENSHTELTNLPFYNPKMNVERAHSNDEQKVIYHMINVLAFMTAQYLVYMQISYKTSYKSFHKYVAEIRDCIDDIRTVQHFIQHCYLSKLSKTFIDTADDLISEHYYAETNLTKYKKLKFDKQYEDINVPLMRSRNAVDELLAWFERLYKRFNYLHDPDNAPYYDLIVPIEDPLISILKQIAEKEGYKNIDKIMELDTLELKERQPYESVSHYNHKSRIIQENADTLDLYRDLIKLGFLDLVERAGIKQQKKINIIHGNREYMYKHILFDVKDHVNDKLRCNDNKDGITQDDLDKGTYPLYKLQLMFMLQNTNADGVLVRTDCFYAPSFYNYIVQQITDQYNNDKTVIKHPMGGNAISVGDINDLMKVMHSIDASIRNPALFIDTPPRDEELELEIDSTTERGYYIVNIVRRSLPISVKLFQICIIPSNIKSSEIRKHIHGIDVNENYSSVSFIKLLRSLFNNGTLLFTYMSPYYDAESGFYVKHQKDVFHLVKDLQTVEGWKKLDREDQSSEFHNLYLQVDKAFTSPS